MYSKDERGFILALALFFMIALTVVGIIAIFITSTETQIAGNERISKDIFYVADSGVGFACPVIRDIVEERTLSDYQYELTHFNVNIVTQENFLNEIMDYPTNNDKDQDGVDEEGNFVSPDLSANIVLNDTGTQKTLMIDVDRERTIMLAGAAAEFAGGYEGVGAGVTSGGIAIIYHIDSRGELRGSQGINTALVECNYKHVLSVAQR